MSFCRPLPLVVGTLLALLIYSCASAATVENELTIAQQEVNYTGTTVEAMQLPKTELY